MPIRGVIFDLDGTLVNSALDFDAMRREMSIEGSLPLLEALAAMPAHRAERCWEILQQHERLGAARAVTYPGVHAFLEALAARGLARAVVTRNSRATTLSLLARLGLALDPVICREDAPVKPDPAAIHQICARWQVPPQQCVVIGDFRFDIEAARRAGAHAVLFAGGGGPSGLADDQAADFVLASFEQSEAFWAWLGQIDLGGHPGSC
jgi:HAD superfamily hydrolase (TIGR01509 family)